MFFGGWIVCRHVLPSSSATPSALLPPEGEPRSAPPGQARPGACGVPGWRWRDFARGYATRLRLLPSQSVWCRLRAWARSQSEESVVCRRQSWKWNYPLEGLSHYIIRTNIFSPPSGANDMTCDQDRHHDAHARKREAQAADGAGNEDAGARPCGRGRFFQIFQSILNSGLVREVAGERDALLVLRIDLVPRHDAGAQFAERDFQHRLFFNNPVQFIGECRRILHAPAWSRGCRGGRHTCSPS